MSAELEASGDPELGALAVQLAEQMGDNAAAGRRLATLQDATATVDARRQALRGLARRGFPALKPALLALLEHGGLRRDAIRATASFDDVRMASTLLARYADFDAQEKLEAVHALASRSRSGRLLTQAIARGDVPRPDVPAYVARQLRRVVGSGFVEVWGPIDMLTAATTAELDRYRAVLTDAALRSADPSQGRIVFARTCLACHVLYGEGGSIGPDLTGSNRVDLDYLLNNVLTPSAVIQDDYRMVLVHTTEGRMYCGVRVHEDERQISLRVTGEDQPVVLAKSSIASTETARVSMMPEGLLRNLTDTEVLDLVAYLRTSQQVPLPRK